MTITLEAILSPKIGFASHQNAVPVLRELQISNGGDKSIDDVRVTLSADPPFLTAKSWAVDSLREGATLHINDRDVELSASFLADLHEQVSGTVRLSVEQGDTILASTSYPVELLARNEWGGSVSMAELLAAFVMPNDPAVDRVLKATSDVLRRAGKPDGIDGYQSGSRKRVWELASAMWSAVAGFQLSYALPPASFERQGQKVRTPGALLEGGIATCLDTALLFAAALEQAGLNPLVVTTRGHAFVGVWLQPVEFATLVVDDAAALRKRIALDELIVFETTLVTQSPVCSFSQAVETGKRQVAEDCADPFEMAIDVRRARMQKIKPLAVASSAVAVEASEGTPLVAEALEEAPSLPAFDVDVGPEPETATGRIALWQRKLLDLTTKNRLLHLPDGAKTVRLVCPNPHVLEDWLAEGKRIKIAPMPDLEAGGRDAALYQARTQENLQVEYAKLALDRGEVLSTLDKAKLEASLVDLYRKARSDMDEGGANTLFLALGFMKWKKSADDPRQYRAPLVLLPVKLDRKSALSGVVMTAHEDEPRFNLTLLELLRQDFELNIPGLEGSLPTDASGIDLAFIWNTVRRAIRDVPGFEVVEDIVLGTFSFAKYLMWKDLADRSDQLMESPVVRHLIERAENAFSSGGASPRPEDLDRTVDPSQLFTPLPADSSQLAAVVAAANGCDFVLDGPPGTGKSQTIANMIAHNLALGRRVLFVAEKMAALDVVYRRLADKGLADFCLELHSAKTSKVEVLRQLDRAWSTRDALTPEEWAREAADVKRLRDNLNNVVAVLHARKPNGLTIHQAMGRTIRDADAGTPVVSWPEDTVHTEADLNAMRDVARRLDLSFAEVRDLSDGAFGEITRTEWSNSWQTAIAAAARDLPNTIDTLLGARDKLVSAAGLPGDFDDPVAIERLLTLTERLLDAYGLDLRFGFAPDFPEVAGLVCHLSDLVARYRETELSLSVAYAPEACRRIDPAGLGADWRAAEAKFWFLATLAKKKVAKRLGELGGTTSIPDPGADIAKLGEMRTLVDEIDRLAPRLTGVPGWSGTTSDTTRMVRLVEVVEGLRAAMSAVASGPDELMELRHRATGLVLDANDLLSRDGAVGVAGARLSERLQAFKTAADRFLELAGSSERAARDFAALRAAAVAVAGNETRLKAWCDWRRVRTEALAAGLPGVVTALEEQAIAAGGAVAAFETGYARWFAAAAIDAEPLLRNFVPGVHVNDIEAYRALDSKLSDLSVRYIRAKVCGLIPDKDSVGKKDGYGVLKHELQKQKRHKPVRQLAAEMGEAFTRLAPCMLMSPLSIAQYLPAEQALFDLVIFDEASQIAPWDAVGSIARGRQVVIAGDPRQMPPTSFFNRSAGDGDGDGDGVEEDMESILGECLASGVPAHSLAWHYRSRHESLIAFSNSRYYDSDLITFPAAVTKASAVEWRRVNGVYARGKKTNQVEAEAIVGEVVRRLTDPLFIASKKTLGIITLNSDQQKVVEDLLDKERSRKPAIERFFSRELPEPVVVKNLETVQGDERDVIMLGIGFGPTEPGAPTMSMHFGALNKDGGWRRLNVALTRARHEMLVFTSFDPSMIDLNRTSARAVRDLKHFLEFADRGPSALAEAVHGSVGGYESPFEEAVARALRDKGWQVIPQIGVSRFRIDLGIVHPDRPGDYLVGVECDGAAYHSAATARDRDKVRAAILKDLGWQLVRVWSTDWWVDKAGATERLHAQIQEILAADREAHQARVADMADVVESAPDASAADLIDSPAETRLEVVPSEPRQWAARPVRLEVAPLLYRLTEFIGFEGAIDPNAFYEPRYDQTLAAMIAAVVEIEAPILDALLVQRIARAHGFKKAGRIIRERVMDVASRTVHVDRDASGSVFIWPTAQQQSDWSTYRAPASEADIRQIEEIALEELCAAAPTSAVDVPVEIARRFGIRRLSATARHRVEVALATTQPV